ncbi:MAG: RluA family pseudouridine synthase [Planctomycetes bacterium]|nr:RluA family pseudouridine synthase [Planctomycetota bacterium]
MLPTFLRVATASDLGQRVDAFLAAQPEVGSRSAARRLLDAGLVTVSGMRAKPATTLVVGDEVAFRVLVDALRDPLAPDLPLPEVRVLFDDAAVCVIDKPAGLAAHPPEDPSVVAHTVASWARARLGDLPSPPDVDRPGIVHRLDRDTTGVMVVAKTAVAMEALRQQWKDRLVEKEYRCVVYGEPRFQSDWIERAIAPDPRHPDRMTTVEEGGRESSTYYEVVERFGGFAHVRCQPKTGRTHQIRVHMTAIGHSLVGDKVYRSAKRQHDRLPPGAPAMARQALHAQSLAFTHPVTQERLRLEAPLPEDMQRLLAWLRAQAGADR